MAKARQDGPSSTLEFRDFPGVQLQSDAHDLPPGAAQDQVNVGSGLPGQLTPRDGMRVVSFDLQA